MIARNMSAKPAKSPKHSLETRRKRLKFQAWHRGTKEADLVLGRFVDQNLETFDEADLDWFDQLLAEADQDILDWVTEKSEPPAKFATPMMARLQTLKHMRR